MVEKYATNTMQVRIAIFEKDKKITYTNKKDRICAKIININFESLL